MGEIIQFRTEDKQGHLSGEAFCINCKYSWAAVAPMGTIILECPECHTMKGCFKYGCGFPEGEVQWTCNCGCQMFVIGIDKTICFHCGLTQIFN
jgi:hypothetical protein